SWMLDAKAYDKGTSPFRGRLGQPVIDSRLTLENRPAHPDLLGVSFTVEGLPTTETAWIERGVLRHLAYDRFTARQHGVDRLPTLEAPVLAAEHARTGGCVAVEDLIRGTERGILVSNFWYIRSVNPTDLTLTGMTRDGTFLIEDGRVTRAVRNFRFHDSPLRVFNQVEQITMPMEATTGENGKMLVPAMKLRDFHFTSVTRF
ncbi:MAG: metallopeptidase TldD-related protein, partial [Nitrospirales bacterium]